MNYSAEVVNLTWERVHAEIQNMMNACDSLSNVLLGEDLSANLLHWVERLLGEINAFFWIAQTYDEVICSACAAVWLENILQACLGADVLLRRDTEIGDGHWRAEVKARQQPAYGDGEQSQNGEKDEQAARTSRHANHQHGAEKQEEGQESQSDRPAEQFIEFVFVDERFEQLVGLRRLDEVESSVYSTDSFGGVLRHQLGRVHHYGESGRVRHRHVPQIIDFQRQRLVAQCLRQEVSLKGRDAAEDAKLGQSYGREL